LWFLEAILIQHTEKNCFFLYNVLSPKIVVSGLSTNPATKANIYFFVKKTHQYK